MFQISSVIFPAWKLFDKPGDRYELFCLRDRDQDPSLENSWSRLSRPSKVRKFVQLFYNPEDLLWQFFHSKMNELCEGLTAEFSKGQKLFAQSELFFKNEIQTKILQLFPETRRSNQMRIVLIDENNTIFQRFEIDLVSSQIKAMDNLLIDKFLNTSWPQGDEPRP